MLHKSEHTWVNIVCVGLQLTILVFVGLASSTVSRFVREVEVENTFTASVALPHLDVGQLLSHVLKQPFLSRLNS